MSIKQLESRSGKHFDGPIFCCQNFCKYYEYSTLAGKKLSQPKLLTLILLILFPGKCCLFIRSAAYIKMHLGPTFIMEANTLNPDQTAPKDS